MYRRPWGPENVGEVGANVNSSHEEFLNEDDPVKKADCLRYFSAYAMQWLGLVGQREKFTLRETDRVLRTSAMQIAEFDPREAAISFEHLAKYAHNLLEQPWRVDFHVLKLTSGFYVHNVAAQLVNAHELLVALGYVHVDEATLKLVPTVDTKRIKIVSRDCLVAAQECLILSQVWQRVADAEPDYPLTIGEVYEARAHFVGDTDTICKTLLADIRQRQYNSEREHLNKKSSMTFVPVDKLIDFDDQIGGTSGSPYRRRETEAERAAREVIRNTRAMHNNSNNITSTLISSSSSSSSLVKTPHRRHEYDDVYFEGTREDSLSPMIPKTVKEFTVNHNSSSSSKPQNNMNSLGNSSSHRSSISNNYGSVSSGGGPMTFSKVKQEPPSPVSQSSNTSERKKSQSGILGAGELYNDSYFPRVVRPTPQYSYQNPHQNNIDSVDGLVKEAFEYKQQVRNKSFPHLQQQQQQQKSNGKISQHSYNNHQQNNSNSPSSEESSSPESTVEVNNTLMRAGYSTLHSSGEEEDYHNHHHHQQQQTNNNRTKIKGKSEVTRLPSIDSVYYDHLLKQGFQETTPPLDNSTRRRCLDDHVKDIISPNSPTPASPSSSTSVVDRSVIRKLEERVNALELGIKTSNDTSPSSSASSVVVVPGNNSYRDDRTTSRSPQKTPPPRPSPPKMDHLKTQSSSTSSNNTTTATHTSNPGAIPLTYSCRHCTFKNKNVLTQICSVCAKSQDFIDEEDDATEFLQTQHNNIISTPKLYSTSTSTAATAEEEVKESNVKQFIECPQCTFHNPPVRRVCDMCTFRFKHVGANESPVPPSPQSYSSAALT